MPLAEVRSAAVGDRWTATNAPRISAVIADSETLRLAYHSAAIGTANICLPKGTRVS